METNDFLNSSGISSKILRGFMIDGCSYFLVLFLSNSSSPFARVPDSAVLANCAETLLWLTASEMLY